METSKLIMSILSVLATVSVTFFAVNAFFVLNKQRKTIKAIHRSICGLYAMRLSDMVNSNLETLQEMRRSFDHLIKEEEYEAAEQLKREIEQAEKMVDKMVDSLLENGVVKKITTIRKRDSDEL